MQFKVFAIGKKWIVFQKTNEAQQPEVRYFKPEVKNGTETKRAGERTCLGSRYFDKLL